MDSNKSNFNELPGSYSKGGLTFSKLERTDKAAIYVSNVNTYEVFPVSISEGGIAKFGGVTTVIEPHEIVPSSSQFGVFGEAYQNKDAAYAAYSKLNS